MAYIKEEIFELAKTAIADNNLFFIEDIIAFIPCVTSTFYKFFPIESEEMKTLKELLNDNKIRTKSSIRSKLWKSEKAAELLALYRLICTPEEHKLLNQSYLEQNVKFNPSDITGITFDE